MTQRYYQWLPGSEYENTVVRLTSIYVEDGEIYYVFDNGSICLEEFIAPFTTDKRLLGNKMLVEIVNPNQKWQFETIKSTSGKKFSDVNAQNGMEFEVPCLEDYSQKGDNINSLVGSYNIIPPKTRVKNLEKLDYKDYMSEEDLISLGIIEKPMVSDIEKQINEIVTNDAVINDSSTITTIVSKEYSEDSIIENTNINNTNYKEEIPNKKICDDDPVGILVNSSVKYPSAVSIDLNIDLPAVSLYSTVVENFENGGERFIDRIISQIDYSKITESLRIGLLNAYNSKISSDTKEY